GYGVWSFVGQWLTLISTNAVMAWTAVDWRPGFKTSRAHLGRAASFGGKVLGLRAGELAATQTPLLVIGATLGPVATGLFSVSWRLVETLSFLIVTPLRQASQSAFAALQRQGGGAGLLLVDIARLTGLVAMPFFAGLAVLAGPIITLVFGEEWLRAAPVLSVMAAMGAYLCISRVQISFCLAAGRAGAISVLAWLIVALAALFIWIASGWGIEAVAAAVVAAHVLLWPFYFVIVARIAGMPVWPFVSCHILPLIGAVLMAVLVGVVAARFSGLLVLAVAVPLGVAAYGAFAVVFMRDRFGLLARYARGQG
ncbi:MAG: oligosaccharide flippase family protein, partial [Albidovulum sp.]